jgi:hypothetical protein
LIALKIRIQIKDFVEEDVLKKFSNVFYFSNVVARRTIKNSKSTLKFENEENLENVYLILKQSTDTKLGVCNLFVKNVKNLFLLFTRLSLYHEIAHLRIYNPQRKLIVGLHVCLVENVKLYNLHSSKFNVFTYLKKSDERLKLFEDNTTNETSILAIAKCMPEHLVSQEMKKMCEIYEKLNYYYSSYKYKRYISNDMLDILVDIGNLNYALNDIILDDDVLQKKIDLVFNEQFMESIILSLGYIHGSHLVLNFDGLCNDCDDIILDMSSRIQKESLSVFVSTGIEKVRNFFINFFQWFKRSTADFIIVSPKDLKIERFLLLKSHSVTVFFTCKTEIKFLKMAPCNSNSANFRQITLKISGTDLKIEKIEILIPMFSENLEKLVIDISGVKNVKQVQIVDLMYRNLEKVVISDYEVKKILKVRNPKKFLEI